MKKKISILVSVVLIIVILSCLGIIIIPKALETLKEKEKKQEILENVKIRALYNEEKYIVEGIPKKVDISLIGTKEELEEITELSNNEVFIDLSKFEVTEKPLKIKLKFNNGDNIEYKIEPSTIKITIKEKISDIRKVYYNLDEIKNNNIINIIPNIEEVVIRGDKNTVEKVNKVKIDLEQVDFMSEKTKENVLLVAIDNEGKKVENIEIFPSRIDIAINKES